MFLSHFVLTLLFFSLLRIFQNHFLLTLGNSFTATQISHFWNFLDSHLRFYGLIGWVLFFFYILNVLFNPFLIHYHPSWVLSPHMEVINCSWQTFTWKGPFAAIKNISKRKLTSVFMISTSTIIFCPILSEQIN